MPPNLSKCLEFRDVTSRLKHLNQDTPLEIFEMNTSLHSQMQRTAFCEK